MDVSTMPTSRSFFVALPDTPAAGGVAARLKDVTSTMLHHASGRPWIVGHVTTDRVVTGRAGANAVAVVGTSSATTADLDRVAASARRPTDLTAVCSGHAGSYVTIGSIDGELFAAGQAMESRRLWSSRIGGIRVVSDRADVLAELGGFDIDPTALALRLLTTLPHPLDRRGLWRQVEPLPGDRHLVIGVDGTRVREGTWWHLPADHLGRAEGADRFRQALEAGVAARTRDGESVACDLSGGLDSTPLCFFAARSPQGVVARTLYNDDPGGDEDLRWARKALESMPGVHTHVVSSTDEYVDFYEGIDDIAAHFDEPTQAVTAGPRIMAMLQDDRRRGIRMHLNGLGGDHILRGIGAWEHSIARQRPLTAWRRARGQHIPDGIGMLSTLRALTDRRPYRAWLADSYRAAGEHTGAPAAPGMNDWSSPISMPPWLSSDARALIDSAVREVMDEAEPLHASMAGHADVFFVREASRLVRSTAQLGQPYQVSYEAPLLDDRIVEAALAVQRTERDTPLEWKPLMKAAMRGLLPNDYLMRTSKVGGGPQSVRGYSRHYSTLLKLMDEARLFDTGLIDRDALLRTTRPNQWETPAVHVYQAINAAVFLRNSSCRPALAAL